MQITSVKKLAAPIIQFPTLLTFSLLMQLSCSSAIADTVCDLKQLKTRETTGMLFSIKSNERVLAYLFGSIHKGLDSMPTLPKAVERALEDSKKYYVEWHPEENENSAEIIAGLFPEQKKQNLRSGLNAENYKKLSHYLDRLRLSPEQRQFIENQEPQKLISDLLHPGVQESMDAVALDLQLAWKVKALGLPVEGLETTQEHWTPLAVSSPSDEESRQREFTTSIDEMINCPLCVLERAQIMACTLELVRVGDPELLANVEEKRLAKSPAARAQAKIIIDDRNIAMLKKIVGSLDTEPRFFISIGAIHLVGKNGILNLMRERGFTVEKVEK